MSIFRTRCEDKSFAHAVFPFSRIRENFQQNKPFLAFSRRDNCIKISSTSYIIARLLLNNLYILEVWTFTQCITNLNIDVSPNLCLVLCCVIVPLLMDMLLTLSDLYNLPNIYWLFPLFQAINITETYPYNMLPAMLRLTPQRALRLGGKAYRAKSALSRSVQTWRGSLYSQSKLSSTLKTSSYVDKRPITSGVGIVEDNYPTRTIKEPIVIPRKDPVIWGHHGKDGLLTQDDFDHFEKYGFVVLKDVFTGKTLQDLTKDVVSRRDEIERDLMASGQDSKLKECRSGIYLSETKSRRLRSIFQTFRHIPLINKLARYSPLLASINQIVNDDVYITQDRINFHAAFQGEGFEWHSDFETWHSEDGIPQPRTVNALVMLSKNVPQNGSLMVIPGSHQHFIGCPGQTPDSNWSSSLQGQYYGIPDRTIIREFGEKYNIQYCTGDPGTVVLTDSNILHGSHSNISHMDRHNLFLVYNAVSNSPRKPYGGSKPRPEYLSTRDSEWMKPLEEFNY